MKHNHIIAREGWIFVALSALLTLLVAFSAYNVLAWVTGFITLFCIFFFRNPERSYDGETGAVLSAADGTVLEVNQVFEDRYLQAEAHQIRIFLSLFNVHINRAPLSGRVELIQKKSGLCLPAYRREAGSKNAKNYVGISTEFGKIMVIQITGMVARRIVCWVRPGETLSAGERFGLIRFGSCTEIYLPLQAKVEVKPGDKVRGGETVIARFTE